MQDGRSWNAFDPRSSGRELTLNQYSSGYHSMPSGNVVSGWTFFLAFGNDVDRHNNTVSKKILRDKQQMCLKENLHKLPMKLLLTNTSFHIFVLICKTSIQWDAGR
ncbi:uncharacterized protein LOC106877962 isoform X2 [Octopus bimaculoides]|uniref:uncharacterized protein LOC106877962 isoform X2 n=1 Tax=Octopus bimaculoides TaxID=37653 RepID=UPI0022E8868C|nr:uncharacterized protein LOC106877962 isoform X2 [Octopus bimaculoides]